NIKTVNFKLLTTNNIWAPCYSSDILQIDDVTLDVFCQDTTHRSISKSVFIEVTAAVTLCSIYVSGGRNVALKASTEQSSIFSNGTYDESFARSENSVDGNTSVDYKDKSCSRTKESTKRPRYGITFHELHTIHAYRLYANVNTTYRLHLRDSKDEMYESHEIILANISNYTAFVPKEPAKSVLLRHNIFIFICEIEIFG
uniref:Uncharacterized protein n=1 Tax=Biomphalaria glabrata TaxID=6526 RepID=A0A2C9LYV1_BIOGL